MTGAAAAAVDASAAPARLVRRGETGQAHAVPRQGDDAFGTAQPDVDESGIGPFGGGIGAVGRVRRIRAGEVRPLMSA